MIEDALHLELVLVVGVPLGQVPELLGQVEAVRNVLRRDEIFGDLDAVVQVSDLQIQDRKQIRNEKYLQKGYVGFSSY